MAARKTEDRRRKTGGSRSPPPPRGGSLRPVFRLPSSVFSSVGPMTLLVLLPRPAPAGLVPAGLLLGDDRARLALLPALPAGGGALGPAGERLHVVLPLLRRAPALGEALLADGEVGDPEHEAGDVLVDRVHHRLEQLGGLALVLQLGVL